MNDSTIPVLIGVGQVTDRPENQQLLSPLELIAQAAEKAIQDAGLHQKRDHIDTIASVGLTVDADQVKTPFKGAYSNLAHSVGKRLGLSNFRSAYAATGGNTPQYLVNHYASEIIKGRESLVLLAGGEALDSMFKRFTPFYKLAFPWRNWKEKTKIGYAPLGDSLPGNTPAEGRYGMDFPSNVYPMFENALQAHYGRSREEHHKAIGELFSRFTEVAAQNPFAWFQKARSAEELITPTPHNRIIAYPYTKYLNSIIKVNQAAAVILTSVAKAKQLGISSDRWVYLNGFANQNDHWYVSERENFYSSPAIRSAGERALNMAKVGIDEIDFFDIYSCFPSAVQIACDALGLKHDDPRGLTLTGGMPYFGGPGNNYSMHAIVEMVAKLREHKGKIGLVNANGWYLTKHALGVYSTQPPASIDRKVELGNPVILDKATTPTYTDSASGSAQVETFTYVCDKRGEPSKVIIIGRDQNHRRFLAEGSTDAQTIDFLNSSSGVIGAQGKVRHTGRKNVFEFA